MGRQEHIDQNTHTPQREPVKKWKTVLGVFKKKKKKKKGYFFFLSVLKDATCPMVKLLLNPMNISSVVFSSQGVWTPSQAMGH